MPPTPTAHPAPTLAAAVRERTGLSWAKAKALCTEGRVRLNGERCLDPAARVAAGATVEVDKFGEKVPTGALRKEAIVHLDRDVVVIDKPAGMLSVADEEGARDTLVDRARTLLRKVAGREGDGPLGVVHRLDRETSGLMVFTRTASALRHLAAQFRDHDLDRHYHAIAHGVVRDGRQETFLLPDRGDGLRGSHGHYRRSAAEPPPEARHAVTEIRFLEALEGATLVECSLQTGRQHQIRIHLAELGHPLLGERVYIRDYTGPVIEAPRTMLHARTLGFVHPGTGKALSFEREAPEDFRMLLAKLRG